MLRINTHLSLKEPYTYLFFIGFSFLILFIFELDKKVFSMAIFFFLSSTALNISQNVHYASIYYSEEDKNHPVNKTFRRRRIAEIVVRFFWQSIGIGSAAYGVYIFLQYVEII